MITYEKGSAPLQRINLTNAVKTDLRGLGTGVGGFSNLATTMYAMIAQFDPEKQPDQRAELRHRIKLLREIVGQEIDRIKGTAAPIVPKEWKKIEKICPEDTDAEKAEKYKHNSMVISKKPYFFRYLYPELNKQFKQYESSYNQMCLSTFGIKLKQLMAKPDKTDAEKKLLRLYHKYSPLIASGCTMNVLCRELEDADFDINFGKRNVSMLPTFENQFTFDQNKLQVVKAQYQKYSSSKQINILNRFFDYEDNCLTSQKVNDFKTIKFKISDSVCFDIREALTKADITPAEVLYYAHELSQQYKKFNWGFVWDILDTQILTFIPQGTTKAPVNIDEIPLEDWAEAKNKTGQYEYALEGDYLGQQYILKDVTKGKWPTYEKPAEPIEVTQEKTFITNIVMTPVEAEPETELDPKPTKKQKQKSSSPKLPKETEEEKTERLSQFMEEFNLANQEDQEETITVSASNENPASDDPEYTADVDDWTNYVDEPSNSFTTFGDRVSDWWDQYLNQANQNNKKEGSK